MRNKFPGTCYRCGEVVEKGTGHFEKNPSGGRWLLQHAECAIFYRGADVGRGSRCKGRRPTMEEAIRIQEEMESHQ